MMSPSAGGFSLAEDGGGGGGGGGGVLEFAPTHLLHPLPSHPRRALALIPFAFGCESEERERERTERRKKEREKERKKRLGGEGHFGRPEASRRRLAAHGQQSPGWTLIQSNQSGMIRFFFFLFLPKEQKNQM